MLDEANAYRLIPVRIAHHSVMVKTSPPAHYNLMMTLYWLTLEAR